MAVQRLANPLIAGLMSAIAAATGCRTAVIAEPRDEATQTIVTVEHRPATQPSDKGLILRDVSDQAR